MSRPRLGFIGLGQLGRPMAERLLAAGFPLAVHNRSRVVVAALAEQGATTCASPREVGEWAEVVLTALPFPDSVESVYLGPAGLLEAARPGLICLDHSTVGPALSRRVAAELAARGAELLDAPVSGGPEGAAAGTLAIMVGGAEAAFERVQPLLATLGQRVAHCGPSGAGALTKLVNQALVTVHSAVAAEALTLAERAGLDPALTLELIGAGLAASALLARNGARILQADYTAGARIELMVKDAALVRDACDDLGLELPVFFAARRAFDAAFAQGDGPFDLAAVVGLVRGQPIGQSAAGAATS
jgi:2-hydroxy-3-oxopropionate reductase